MNEYVATFYLRCERHLEIITAAFMGALRQIQRRCHLSRMGYLAIGVVQIATSLGII